MKHRDPLEFYRETITPEYVNGLLRAAGISPRSGVFTAATVIWLMIAQRMRPNATLAQALSDLRTRRESELLALAPTSGRARTRSFANNTSAYAQARKRLPVVVASEVADLLNQIILSEQIARGKRSQQIFIIDGTTLQVAHSPDNLAKYFQHRNQHCKAHYPLVRICLATHADTGVIGRPVYGPYGGKKAVSEIQLAHEVLSQLPADATVIGDRGFGCFRFVSSAQEKQLQVICRMKITNAASVIGHHPEGTGEAEVNWTPSRRELIKYPELQGASITGKFFWCPLQEKGRKKETLVLFSTANLSLEEVVKAYGRRWLVETDLRDIKSTLKMNFVNAKSPEMIEKEIILGACAYNMIRYMMTLAATAAKLSARRVSFTAVLRRINALAQTIICDGEWAEFPQVFGRALSDVEGLMLPIRAGPRQNEPRKVWSRGSVRTMSKSRKMEKKRMPKRRIPVITRTVKD